jgi:hypothetical protein
VPNGRKLEGAVLNSGPDFSCNSVVRRGRLRSWLLTPGS